MHYVYIVQCNDGTFYTGYTTEVKRRIREHNQGEGAKYTRGRLPVSLMYQEEYESRSKAMQREYAIKNLDRTAKEKLIEAGEIEKKID